MPLAAPSRMDAQERAVVLEAVAHVLDDGQLVLGPWVEEFERRFARALRPQEHAPAVVGVANGSDALILAITALGLPAGSTVLVPANDGGFAAKAVAAAGFAWVPVDVDDHSMLVTAEKAAEALVPSTGAVVVTHLHGQPANLGELDRWRRSHGLRMIEDCAQAHGAQWDGRHVGLTGDAATFSFYPTKNLGCLGDGGAVVCGEPELAARVRRLREYGWGPRFCIDEPDGRNSRLDAVQAAVLCARLPGLVAHNQRRRTIVRRYREALAGSAAYVLGDAPGAVAHHAVVVDPRRDVLAGFLESCGIRTAVHYPWLVTEMPGLTCGTRPPLPGADTSRRTKLSVPCFPTMTEAEVDYVCGKLRQWAA